MCSTCFFFALKARLQELLFEFLSDKGRMHQQRWRDRPQKTSAVSGEGIFPVLTFCGQEGVLQMQTSALFGAKTPDFSKIILCPHRQREGGWARADILRTRGKEVNFSRLYADVLYWRPLS